MLRSRSVRQARLRALLSDGTSWERLITFKEALASRDFEVQPNAERPLTRETLGGADVLVIAHPSDPKWEATTNSRTPRLSDRELDAIEEFVRGFWSPRLAALSSGHTWSWISALNSV